MNKKLKSSQKGFGSVGIVILIVVIALIGAIGWHVYHTYQTTKKDSNNDAANISPAGTNPTSGWPQQCLASEGLCVKYPSAWTVGLLSSTGFTVTSPDNTAFVQVDLVGTYPSYTENVYVTSQAYTYSEGTKYKVFGGYIVSQQGTGPFYAVVLSGFGDPHAMKVNTTENILDSQFIDYAHKTSNGSLTGVLASIKLLPLNGVPTTNATSQESTTWLNSATAQTGQEILKSVTTN
jgi:hypothetical protein